MVLKKLAKYLSFCCVAIMLTLGCLCLAACGVGEEKGECLYTLAESGDHYVVTGTTTKKAKTFTIAATYNGLPVTAIGDDAFYQCAFLRSVEIPEGVTSLGEFSFAKCFELTNITLPSSLTSIGYYAFGECHEITDITLPENLETLGDSVFFDCEKLRSLTIPNSVKSLGRGGV